MPPPRALTTYTTSLQAFHKKLLASQRILAVCGAGLSAASGLPTFRGSAGALWRTHKATDLATPEAFRADPGLVWSFYAQRRRAALRAEPNRGHLALAALGRWAVASAAEGREGRREFLCLSQNVDDLHSRASHPPSTLRLLHGSLFSLKCASQTCTWTEQNNTLDPLCAALVDPTSQTTQHIPPSALPTCPQCKTSLQRPGVVWFGEQLDASMLAEIDDWIARDEVDIVLVIGTSSAVYPAAGFAEQARGRGRKTSVVTVNLDAGVRGMKEGDFAFAGDAAVLLPLLLGPVIGEV
ncbi:DHS-like NAD/FAD-binding domain-containing protein [Cercophora scortea]|uniref:DHS-like NAD/FAD-binding domain-containing protein n=1 Tax=Cercophora scortea TaxID=314031 RepID=A0AAE0MIN5_9PEZI|nr:DHS-like NAD/FAD-binding domain-containing protein [Cercophora scortea]